MCGDVFAIGLDSNATHDRVVALRYAPILQLLFRGPGWIGALVLSVVYYNIR